MLQDAINVADLKFAVGTTEAKMDMALGNAAAAQRHCSELSGGKLTDGRPLAANPLLAGEAGALTVLRPSQTTSSPRRRRTARRRQPLRRAPAAVRAVAGVPGVAVALAVALAVAARRRPPPRRRRRLNVAKG